MTPRLRRALIGAWLTLGSGGLTLVEATPFMGYTSFTPDLQTLPMQIQMELRSEPDNAATLPIVNLPRLPGLRIDLFAGSSWKMNDGYGPWPGDGESPLATAKDISHYDQVQTHIYLQNEQSLEKFNRLFAIAMKRYQSKYALEINQMVVNNQNYQAALLTYPQAVTKTYVLNYIRMRDMFFEQARSQWVSSVFSLKRQLQFTLGHDLEDINAYETESALDGYTRTMSSNLVRAETQTLNNDWRPLFLSPLQPLTTFEKVDLTAAQAEKMTWGMLPQRTSGSSARGVVNANNSQAWTKPSDNDVTIPGQAPTRHEALAQWLAALLLLGGGGVFAFFKLRRRRSTPDRDSQDTTGT